MIASCHQQSQLGLDQIYYMKITMVWIWVIRSDKYTVVIPT